MTYMTGISVYIFFSKDICSYFLFCFCLYIFDSLLLHCRVHQKFLVPGSLLVNSEHHPQMIQESQFSTVTDESQMILPSVLVEDKSFGVRNRDTSKTQVT